VIDFTSALYLGMRHPASALQPWTQLTTGVPAALGEPTAARMVARKFAELQGCEDAVLGSSTLHLFWDLFGMFTGDDVTIFLDSGAYPIVRWGVERAAARGVAVRNFRHHDKKALCRQLSQTRLRQTKPVVVCDGLCPACAGPAPLAAYLDEVHALRGLLIVDDTQALGILGQSPSSEKPYGRGGGGSLPWSAIEGQDVLAVSSLAKGFGVPAAVLAGSEKRVRAFRIRSETRVHCSPLSIASLRAAEHALAMNRNQGDAVRLQLANRVSCFRQVARQRGFRVRGGHFPVQSPILPANINHADIHRKLLALGVHAVLHKSHPADRQQISFLVRADHSECNIIEAIAKFQQAINGTPLNGDQS